MKKKGGNTNEDVSRAMDLCRRKCQVVKKPKSTTKKTVSKENLLKNL